MTRITIVSRRDALLGSGSAALVAVLLGTAGTADAAGPAAAPAAGPATAGPATAGPATAAEGPASLTYEQAMKAILGEAKPITSPRLFLDLPEIAENGNTVPFSLSVDSPMTPADHVKAAHVVSSGNPQPSVASFYFSDASGKAAVTSRMRLAKTQNVVALAELSNGSFLISTRNVKVTIGGCGG